MKLTVLLAAAAAMGLAACSVQQTSISLGKDDISVNMTDAKSSVTVTRNRDKDTGEITYASSAAGPAEFTFSSRPGGQALYIIGYRIVSDIVDGTETVTAALADIPYESNISIYVPNGYSCTPAAPKGQSCSINDKTAKPANGVPTEPLGLYLAGIPGELVKNSFPSGNHVRETTFEFRAIPAAGNQVYTIRVPGVTSAGYFAGTPKANAGQP